VRVAYYMLELRFENGLLPSILCAQTVGLLL
jgi:hypothetical protein